MIGGLTAKQMRFAEEIARGKTQIEAATLAGYAAKSASSTASKLVRDPKVRAYMRQLTGLGHADPGRDQRIADAVEVAEFLTSVMRGELTEMVATKEGMVDVPPRVRDRVSAAEKLCKVRGYNPPEQVEFTGSTGDLVAELEKMAAALRAEEGKP